MNIIRIISSWVLIASTLHSDVVLPSFTHPSSRDQGASFLENINFNTSIYEVRLASPLDYNVTIQTQNSTQPPFQLVKDLLVWNLLTPANATIDRETMPQFTFVFCATDGTHSELSVPLTLVILDENDNTPQFTNDSYTATINNTAGPIFTIQATDADESPRITYSITAGDSNKTFAIDPITGQLNLTTPSKLNATTTPTYNLTVQASDGTNVNYKTVIIHVEDDLCIPSPCLNNGRCSRNHTNYTCTCAAGWLGDNCKEADTCFSKPCKNGGVCAVTGMTFKCNCTSGFHGFSCNETVPTSGDPCNFTTCTHGETCIVAGTSFSCLCVSGMTGNSCSTMVATAVPPTAVPQTSTDTKHQESKADSSSNLLAVYIVVPMLAVMGIVVAAIVIYKYKTRKKVAQEGPRNQCFDSSHIPNKEHQGQNGPQFPPINKSNKNLVCS